MATELLLMDDVAELGKAGDVVNVADGYSRNYLIPKGLGEKVTAAARRRLQALRKQREELARLRLDEARDKAKKLESVSCTLRVKTADGQRLYGSVTTADILVAIEAHGVALDRSQLRMEAPIKELGMFEIPVKLHEEISVPVKVWVVEG